MAEDSPRIGVVPAGGTALHRPVSKYVGARRTILVVDDQLTQRQMLACMLLPLGFRTREAASGAECIDSIVERQPDAGCST